MVTVADALVIGGVDVGGSDRLISVLTAEFGRLSVMVKGAKSDKCKVKALIQPYTYANMELYSRNGMYWLKTGTVIEFFPRLKEDFDKICIAAYMADVCRETTEPDIAAEKILRLALNAFYGLDRDVMPPRLIKAVFEFRIACCSGYAPYADKCSKCGADALSSDLSFYFDAIDGCIICANCLNSAEYGSDRETGEDLRGSHILYPVNYALRRCFNYLISCPEKRIFAFKLTEEKDIADFCSICESFILNQLERSFKSLDFLKLCEKGSTDSKK